MLKAVILICSALMPQSECNIDNADSKILLPDPAKTPLGCFLFAQQYIGQTEIKIGEKQYMRIICQHPQE